PERQRFYSSKPPLFATLLAGPYWVLYHGLHWSFTDHPLTVVRILLWLTNVLPLAVYLLLLGRLLERLGTAGWGQFFVLVTACFGTFLTTFADPLNNHTPAAYCTLFAVYPLVHGRGSPAARGWLGAAASGLFAGLAASFEFPAVALTAGLFVLLFVRQWELALLGDPPAPPGPPPAPPP